MANKYLEKIAGDHVLKGFISPAWQENAIAKEHGKEGLNGVGDNVGKHITGVLRQNGRGILEGLGAGALGAGVGSVAAKALKLNPVATAGAAGYLGYSGGVLHGAYRSTKNQAAEAHKKYSK